MQDQCLLSVYSPILIVRFTEPDRQAGRKTEPSRRSSEEERLNPDPVPLDQRKQWSDRGRLSAHNGEDVGSKPTAGIIRFFIFYRSLSKYFYNSFHGILLISRFAEGATSTHYAVLKPLYADKYLNMNIPTQCLNPSARWVGEYARWGLSTA